MGGILHRPKAISKNSSFQQPTEASDSAGTFEQAAMSTLPERRTV